MTPRIELPCFHCDGRGYQHSGSSSIDVCPKCKGSGDKYAKPSYLLQTFIERTKNLKESLKETEIDNACLREQVMDLQKKGRRSAQTILCTTCGGKGIRPSENKWDEANLSIRRCGTCDGTGVDRAVTVVPRVVQRLWYEVDRLQEVIGRKFREWESNKHPYQPPPPAPLPILDRDVWLFVLGLNGSPSRDEIRKAYKQKATDTHPDVGGTNEAFTVVQAAHDKLMEECRD